ncbi:MAG: sulfite exporter TauE/SafE family protein [Desulfobacteraceae bacterium]|jgi:uncharacterized membrane protein YfcA
MMPDYPPAFWLCAVAAVMIFGIAKAGFGSGIGIVATPLLSLTIPVTDAVALLLPLLIITDVFSVNHYRMHFSRRSIKLLLPGALLGIAIGGLFFSSFRGNERILRFAIGVLALWFVLFQAFRAKILGVLEKRRPHATKGVLMGAISGFTSTLAHAGGPPVAMYLLPQKFPRDLFVGTTVIYFAVVNLVKLIPYHTLGLLRVGDLATIMILAPLTYVGVRLGIYLNRRFTDLWFNRLVYTILFLTGVQLVLGKNMIAMLFG